MRSIVVVVTLLAAVLSSVLPSQAAEAQLWAFLYADQPVTQSYQPVNQKGSRTDIRAGVTRLGTGSYKVTIAGAGAPGVPLVTAAGGSGLHCQLTQFRQNNTAEEIMVACYAGTFLADSRFTLSFFWSTGPDSGSPGAYGYVHNNQPKAGTIVNPSVRYNSTGGNVDIYRHDTGIWTVRFFGQQFNNVSGNVQVSAVGLAPVRCAVIQWYPHVLGADAQVRCDPLTDGSSPEWTLVYPHERSIVGHRSGFFGYLQANQPTAPVYTPNPDRNRAPDGFLHTVSRSSPGRYQAQIYGPLKEPVTVHLTVNGDTGHYCDIVGWTMRPSLQPAGLVDVACFDNNGIPADNWFSLNYYSP